MSFGESKGKLYYVRLKTNCGVLYKIGFTKLESVEKRLAYGGSRDAELIDKVFLFLELDDAYQVEQELHALLYSKKAFEKYSCVDEYPLCNNGQTELYTKDVLRMDSNYTDEQGSSSALNIREKILYANGSSLLQDKIVGFFLMLLFSPIIFISNMMDKKKYAEEKERLEAIISRITEANRVELIKQEERKELLRAMQCEMEEIDATVERKAENKKRVVLARQKIRERYTKEELVAKRERELKEFEPAIQKLIGSSKVGEELLDELEAMTPIQETVLVSLTEKVRLVRFLPLGYNFSDIYRNDKTDEWIKYNKLFDDEMLTKDEFKNMVQSLVEI